MPVMMCGAAAPCSRLISVSAVPGGNPAAAEEPDVYASEWTRCLECSSYTCDRCLQKQGGRCKCGTSSPLLSEPQRIQIAKDMMMGKSPAEPQAVAVARVAPGPVAGPAPGAGVVRAPLRTILEAIGADLEADLARGHHEKVRSQARLVATMMSTRMGAVALDDIPWLMRFGESFYRWQCFEDGYRYWYAFLDVMGDLGKGTSHEALVSQLIENAFSILCGRMAASDPSAAKNAAAMVKLLGPQHPLTCAVQAKLARPVSAAPVAHAAPAPPPPVGPTVPSATPAVPPLAESAVPRVKVALPPPQLSPALAAFDGSTRLALWVTLAFLDVALADGRVGDDEYASWRNVMARSSLPDVWQRFGLPTLQQMLQHGALYELSAHHASSPVELRVKMTNMLVEFMFADGRADVPEVASVQKIAAWLGVQIELGSR